MTAQQQDNMPSRPDSQVEQPSAADSAALRLIHFSDLHLWQFGLDGDFFPKRLLGLGNLWLRRRHKFPFPVAEAMIARIAQEPADYVFFSGDLTTTALRAEFEAGARLLTPIARQWQERFLAIPGNHDRYTPRALRLAHFETLFYPGRPALPARWDLSGEWSLVAFETTRPRLVSSRGEVTPQTFEALRALLVQLHAEGRRIVAMGHYPLALPPGVEDPWDHALPQAERVARLLEEYGVRLYLHGHKHRRWRYERNGLIYLNSGSAGQVSAHAEKGPGYSRITLRPMGAVEIEIQRLIVPDPPQWETVPLR